MLKLKQESLGAGDLWSTCLVVLSRGFPHELLVRSRLKEGQEDGAKERCPDLLDAAAARLRFACAYSALRDYLRLRKSMIRRRMWIASCPQAARISAQFLYPLTHAPFLAC